MNSHATSECSEAYIALGANLGDREDNLMEALERLHEVPGIMVERVSNLYETEPVGYVDQPMFLNMAAAVSTSLSPHELLAEMQRIEKQLGRVRHIHWGRGRWTWTCYGWKGAVWIRRTLYCRIPVCRSGLLCSDRWPISYMSSNLQVCTIW